MSNSKPVPCYTSERISAPAYKLRYVWTAWLRNYLTDRSIGDKAIMEAVPLWEDDGIRVLDYGWHSDQIQVVCSVKPSVSPILFTTRLKGRLQHAFRSLSFPIDFSRKVSFRTIGDNRRDEVEAYIANQVKNERFADPRFEAFIDNFTVGFNEADLSLPTETTRGRYWYNLHIVIVTQHRTRYCDGRSLAKLSRWCSAIAGKKGYLVSSRSVMPDHIHLALRGNIEQSPEHIVFAFMNNLAYAFGQQPIFEYGYYVGTFGEYDMGVIRNKPEKR